ncbi:hypothetical protein [Actinosynnema sp. NPDC023587]|uniref:hypothetical protein n=1 Tax=Actinosynnema sp. NPDC023587 TaxID=3154695 RepID=UPI0033F4D98B
MTHVDDPRPPTPSGAAGGPAGAREGWFDAELLFVPPGSPTGARLRSVTGTGGDGPGTPPAGSPTAGSPAADAPTAGPGDGWFDPGLPTAPDRFPAEGPHPFLARALAERAVRALASTDQNSREG